jgi:hypothetical protein
VIAALNRILIALGVVLVLIAAADCAAGDRSRVLRAEFVREHPCPATGARRGACPGYQVDHRDALICGGRDELRNMQWLTDAEHRAKTRVEVKLCRPHKRGPS